MKRILLLLTAAIALPVSVWAQKEMAFKAGEKLSYAISHSYIKSADVIGVVFQTTATTVDGREALKVQATGKTLSGYRAFFDINDTYETYLDAANLSPLRFSSRLQENKYRFRADYVYDWQKGVVDSRYRKLSRPDENHKTMKLPKGAGDALALFYNLRCEDVASMKVGERHNLQLVLDDTVRVITYRYMGRETKKIGRAGRFNTLKIICSMATSADINVQGELFAEGSEFSLWLTDDKNKMPLYIESPIKFGSIESPY